MSIDWGCRLLRLGWWLDEMRYPSFGGQGMRVRVLGLATVGVILFFLLGAPAKAQQGIASGFRDLSSALRSSKGNGAQPRTAYREGSPGLLRKFGHYVTTHKELLLMDSLIVLPISADAASTVHCQRVSRLCTESNVFLGLRPSAAKVWGGSLGASAAIITANHLAWRALNHQEWPSWRHVPFAWDALIVIESAYNTKKNVYVAEWYQSEARKRLMSKD